MSESLSEYRGIDAEAMASNGSRIEMVRVTMAICGGLVAGICRLQGAQGFLAFVLSQSATSLAIFLVCMKGDVDRFANTHLASFMTLNHNTNHDIFYFPFCCTQCRIEGDGVIIRTGSSPAFRRHPYHLLTTLPRSLVRK